jgi:probable F420-dependent oxidoreductase
VIVDRSLELDLTDPTSAARSATNAAAAGYDRLYSAETTHDPFLPVALAAGVSDIELGTNIAVAFARTPMTTAKTAHDLQTLTGGRFVLGLGSQVKAHVTRRYSMPWSSPAARMREYVLALRAIWDHWEQGTPLNFDGDFYTHTLSAPLFDPAPHGHGDPKVLLAAVGPLMTQVAGEVADGVLCHAFTSASYIEHVTLPAVRVGLDKAQRIEQGFEVGMPLLVATGLPGVDLTPEVERIRSQIAFYASTPAYAGVLEHHGWSDLHAELHTLSREQRWSEMTSLLADDILGEFCVIAQADELADKILERYGHVLTNVRLSVPYADDPAAWGPVIEKLKAKSA